MALTLLRATGQQRAIDTAAVRAAISVLCDARHGVEIRSVPFRGATVCRAADRDAICEAAQRFSDYGVGVYYTLNPVPADLIGNAKDVDVLFRRLLLIDVDPVRTSGDPKDNATAEEKEVARLVAVAIMDWLTELGWPAPLLIDSGNGWHLIYRIDLPNNDHAKLLVRNVLCALGDKFDTPAAGVDRSVANASRIAKLPGTWACKGPHSAERPHRLARTMFCPEVPEIVTAEQLEAVAKAAKEQVATNGKPLPPRQYGLPKLTATDGGTAEAYGRKALDGECARVRLAIAGPQGGRNNALNAAAFSLGQLVAGGVLAQSAVEGGLYEAAIVAGLDDKETRGTIRSGLVAGMKLPRTPKPKPEAEPAASAVPAGESIIIRASKIVPRKVEWLWPGRIPLGKLTTFAGVGGLGKTFVLCDITARVTRGSEWPHSGGECAEPGQVLFLSGEDDPDDTLVPRLIELGADLDKVCFLRSEVQDQFTLKDLVTLDKALAEVGDGVRFVVIDPPSCFLGEADDHKNAEVRSLLGPLKSWAAKHRLGVVFNTHFTKPGSAKVEAAMRVMGSVAWVNAVRAAHIFARDPEDVDKVLFVPLKMNLTKRRHALAYKIVETTADMAKVEWLGEVDTTADAAASGDHGKPRRVVASEWLVERFRERLEWESKELFDRAKHDGVSRNAVFEAKTKLDLPRARRTTEANGDFIYHWWVPEDWPLLSRVPTEVSGQQDSSDEEFV